LKKMTLNQPGKKEPRQRAYGTSRAGSGPMRPCAAARGPYREGAHNFVYPSTYISIHLKKLQRPAQHIPCGLCHRLDSSRFSQLIMIVISPIVPASSLRAHTANLGPIYIRLKTHAANLAKGPAQHRSGPGYEQPIVAC
jgi:hypothetical protein